jgi:hypothetical protein
LQRNVEFSNKSLNLDLQNRIKILSNKKGKDKNMTLIPDEGKLCEL